ncbi:MAG TPA: molybdopterin cofactor-binding domain-containing protein [Saprospiraceae bacterium]|nr:molybdopterin cofactor-binding domain-containing protein [Saprospiraceae bacterium]
MERLKIKVNGNSYELLVDPHETLAAVLRNRLDLVGTKIGCDQGNCGCCTVIANDQPVLSCITPALRYDGSDILTIEGLKQGVGLHELQKKFVAHGAIQCGFCTPGMIMTAVSFADKNPRAGKQEIKTALSGNLCRCTGYKKIIEAVVDYIDGVKSEIKTTVPAFRQVGIPRPSLEAARKATGTALYADDLKLRNALHCKFLRSIHPHARILHIDAGEALKMEGVRYIATGEELPARFGVLPISQDQTAMAIGKTRYIGEIVAAVAAETEEQAEAACRNIQVSFQPLDPFFEMEESMQDVGEKEKIHEHVRLNNNVHKKAELRFGDQRQGLETSDVRIKMSFEFAGLSHGFTEPHAAQAYWDENGLTISTATQVPHYLHRSLAKVLEIPLHKVRVIKPFVGGGFGGKSDPFSHEIIIAHLSRKCGRPVRVRLNREEVFLVNHGRHPSRMNVEMGVMNDGRLNVLDADILIDGGAYGSFGVVTSYYNGVLLQAPYKLENFGFRTFRLYTNKPVSGAMRGHGAVNSRFAVESTIDALAEQIGMDPCELRLKNFLDPYTMTVGQYRITSNGSRESLLKVMEQSRWTTRIGKLPKNRGLGVGCGFFISGSALPIIWNELPQSVVHLKLDFDGRVLLTSGASDIGQGSDTMLAMIVAEVLGIGLDRIFVLAADTLLTPVDFGSYSSRVTFMAGNAARDAAEQLRKLAISIISARTSVPEENLCMEDERVFSTDRSVDLNWIQAVDHVTAHRGAVTVSGKYISPKLGGDFKGAGAGLSPSYSFGACIAEVEVDPETGQVTVIDVWGAHDCGKAINPLAVEGQLEGSWHMGIGQALTEQLSYFKGLQLNNNFLDYKIPGTLDTPEIHTNIIETMDPEGPFGAKECGEGALHPVIPAIANAVYNATGVRVTKLPIQAEEILEKREGLHASHEPSKMVNHE